MRKAVGYISSHKRHEIEREIELKIQDERIKDYCKKNELEFIKHYIEPEKSTEDYKVALFSLLDEANQKRFQDVIILNIDRLGTDSVGKTWIINELKKNGIKLHSLTEDLTFYGEENSAKLQEKAESIKSKIKDIPSLPEVVNKVIELVRNPNSSASQLATTISNDTGLTLRVLRLVNSAYYGFPKQISSIQHAIAILGFTTIRGVVLSSSIFNAFSPKAGGAVVDYKKHWKHSFLTALIAKQLNSDLRLYLDDNIFSAAILHDMGKIVLSQYDYPNYVLALSEQTPYDIKKNLAAEKKYCAISHPEAGELIAKHWNLPEIICQSVKFHHSPSMADDEYKRAVSLIYLANLLSNMMENDNNVDANIINEEDIEVLGLTLGDLSPLFTELLDLDFEPEELENMF